MNEAIIKAMEKEVKRQKDMYNAELKLRLEIAEKIRDFSLEYGLIADSIQISRNNEDRLYSVEIKYIPHVFDAVEETVEGDNNHPSVDLGLPSGLLWATCNVGATNPEDYGDYFAWGDTKTKNEYTKENCWTYGNPMPDISGDASYDVARSKWGGNWRMPTKSEWDELRKKCQWEWTTVNGVYGYRVTGSNGNSIFLPAAGYRDGSYLNNDGLDGNYWSSTPNEDGGDYAYYLYFSDKRQYVHWYNRYYGQSVRPVKGSVIEVEFVEDF